MGSSGYQAFQDTYKKFTQRQLMAPGCQQEQTGRYAAASNTTPMMSLNPQEDSSDLRAMRGR